MGCAVCSTAGTLNCNKLSVRVSFVEEVFSDEVVVAMLVRRKVRGVGRTYKGDILVGLVFRDAGKLNGFGVTIYPYRNSW